MAYAGIEDLLRRTIGLDVASVGSLTIERAIQSRISACQLKDSHEYLERLYLSETERQEFFDAIVVPETWFFRDREAFAAMTRMLHANWLPKHPEGVLRLLSLPCCTGEEPYSMAIALLEAGLPARRFHIDAMDLSTRALTQAREAFYGNNAFRDKNTDFRDRYFAMTEQGYQLAEAVREQVQFRHGNLLDTELLQNAGIYDVIYCRNLLIYFDAETQQRAMQILARLLTPQGYLFLGPSETALPSREMFAPIKIPRSFAFQKIDPAIAKKDVASTPRRIAKVAPKPTVVKSRHPPAVLKRPSAAAQAAKTPASLEEAQKLADNGKLVEAERQCQDHLRDCGPSLKAYSLLGLIHEMAGDSSAAVTAYRKALYLEPDHYETLMHLALLLEKLNDAAGAKVLHDRARRSHKKSGGANERSTGR